MHNLIVELDPVEPGEGVIDPVDWMQYMYEIGHPGVANQVLTEFSLMDIYRFYGFATGSEPVSLVEMINFERYVQDYEMLHGRPPSELSYSKSGVHYLFKNNTELEQFLELTKITSCTRGGVFREEDIPLVNVNMTVLNIDHDTFVNEYNVLSFIVTQDELELAPDVKEADSKVRALCQDDARASILIAGRERGFSYSDLFHLTGDDLLSIDGPSYDESYARKFFQLHREYIMERKKYLISFLRMDSPSFTLGCQSRAIGFKKLSELLTLPDVQILYRTVNNTDGNRTRYSVARLQLLFFGLVSRGYVEWKQFPIAGPLCVWINLLGSCGISMVDGGLVNCPVARVNLSLQQVVSPDFFLSSEVNLDRLMLYLTFGNLYLTGIVGHNFLECAKGVSVSLFDSSGLRARDLASALFYSTEVRKRIELRVPLHSFSLSERLTVRHYLDIVEVLSNLFPFEVAAMIADFANVTIPLFVHENVTLSLPAFSPDVSTSFPVQDFVDLLRPDLFTTWSSDGLGAHLYSSLRLGTSNFPRINLTDERGLRVPLCRVMRIMDSLGLQYTRIRCDCRGGHYTATRSPQKKS